MTAVPLLATAPAAPAAPVDAPAATSDAAGHGRQDGSLFATLMALALDPGANGQPGQPGQPGETGSEDAPASNEPTTDATTDAGTACPMVGTPPLVAPVTLASLLGIQVHVTGQPVVSPTQTTAAVVAASTAAPTAAADPVVPAAVLPGTQPTQPTQVAQPAQPAQPAQSAQPAQPAQSTQPAQPCEVVVAELGKGGLTARPVRAAGAKPAGTEAPSDNATQPSTGESAVAPSRPGPARHHVSPGAALVLDRETGPAPATPVVTPVVGPAAPTSTSASRQEARDAATLATVGAAGTGDAAAATPAPSTPAAAATPSAPTTPTTTPTTSGAPTATHAVAAQVLPSVTRLVNRGDGVHRVTLQLNPRALGDVRVVLTMRQGDVHVRLAAGDEARVALASSSGELSRALEQLGVRDHKISLAGLGDQVATTITDTVAASTGATSTDSSTADPNPDPRNQSTLQTSTGDAPHQNQQRNDHHSGTGDDQFATDGTSHHHRTGSPRESVPTTSTVRAPGSVDLRM